MKKTIKLIVFILGAIIFTIFILKKWIYHNINKEQVPVLMYHNVVYDEYYNGQPDTISFSGLEEQLKYLKNNDYDTLTLDEFYCWKKNKCNISKKSVVLTFDDGFYSFYYIVIPLLEKYDMHAVSFVIGTTTEDITPQYNPYKYGTIGKEVINTKSKYAEYGSHSYDMHKMFDNKKSIECMTKSEILNDFNKMESVGNFKYMSYPFNTENTAIRKILKEKKYKLAFYGESEKAGKKSDDYRIPRIGVNSDNIDEFKLIFETNNKNNKYGYGILRKLIITIERYKNKMR